MKITINVEIDTENPQDASTIEELIQTLKELQRQCSD